MNFRLCFFKKEIGTVNISSTSSLLKEISFILMSETNPTKGIITTPNVVNTKSIQPSTVILSGEIPSSSCVSRNAV